MRLFSEARKRLFSMAPLSMIDLIALSCLLSIVSCSKILYADNAFQYGSSGGETVRDIVANDHEIFITGETDSSLYGELIGSNDAYLAKYDYEFNLMSAIQWGSDGNDRGVDIILHPTDTVLYLLYKLNSLDTIAAFSSTNFTQLWSTPSFNNLTRFACLGFDNITSTLWAAGASYASFPAFGQTNSGQEDALLMQLSPVDGSVLNVRLYGTVISDGFNSMVIADSKIYTIGYYNYTDNGGIDASIWITSYDNTGSLTDSLTIPDSYGSGIDIAVWDSNIIVMADSYDGWELGGYELSGYTMWVGSFFPNLTLNWVTEYREFYWINFMQVSNGIGFVGGETEEEGNVNYEDFFIGIFDAKTGEKMDTKIFKHKNTYDFSAAMFALDEKVWFGGSTSGNYAAVSAGGDDLLVQKAHVGNAKNKNFPLSAVIAACAVGAVLLAVVIIIIVRRLSMKSKPVDLPVSTESPAPREAHQYSTQYETLGLRASPSPDINITPETTYQELLPVTNRPGSALMNNWLIDYKELRLDKKIGHGAFGEVYKAKYRGSSVAVKQMIVAVDDDIKIQDFFAEAELMKGLRPHPNITQLLGVCTQPLCIVTEFVANGSLYAWLKSNKPLEDSTKFEIIKGTAAGMFHLHRQGVIHRDLAARNILLDKAMQPKVADFGLSRVTIDNVTNKTETSVGPVKWMVMQFIFASNSKKAPEALMERLYNQKTDVWSFGVVIYEVLTREIPYKNYNLMQIGAAVGVGKLSLVPDIEQRAEEFPEALVGLLKMCLQFEAKNRPDFQFIVDDIDKNSLSQSQNVVGQ